MRDQSYIETGDGVTVQGGEKHLVIKKYANRKFYNTETSQYVTLNQIKESALTRSVIVIDNVSKRDITSKTLLMSIVETVEETKELSTVEIVGLIRRSQNKT